MQKAINQEPVDVILIYSGDRDYSQPIMPSGGGGYATGDYVTPQPSTDYIGTSIKQPVKILPSVFPTDDGSTKQVLPMEIPEDGGVIPPDYTTPTGGIKTAMPEDDDDEPTPAKRTNFWWVLIVLVVLATIGYLVYRKK